MYRRGATSSTPMSKPKEMAYNDAGRPDLAERFKNVRSIFLIRVQAITIHPHDTSNHTGHRVGCFVERVYNTEGATYFRSVDHTSDATMYDTDEDAQSNIDRFCETYVTFEIVEFHEVP